MYLSAPPHPLSGDGMAAARIPTNAFGFLALTIWCRISSSTYILGKTDLLWSAVCLRQLSYFLHLVA